MLEQSSSVALIPVKASLDELLPAFPCYDELPVLAIESSMKGHFAILYLPQIISGGLSNASHSTFH